MGTLRDRKDKVGDFANSINISHYHLKYYYELSDLKYPVKIFSKSSMDNIDKVQLLLGFIAIIALREIEGT